MNVQVKQSRKLSEFELLDSTEKVLKQSSIDGQTGKPTIAYFKKVSTIK